MASRFRTNVKTSSTRLGFLISDIPSSSTVAKKTPSPPARKMKDTRQGAASIVFIVFYTFTLAFVSYCFFVRRAKRYVFALFLFNIIRLGANIASLGWSIYLWENISWLTAALILGTEGASGNGLSCKPELTLSLGYFALVLAIL